MVTVGKIWQSETNGWVYHRGGVSPTICCGAHGGCTPKFLTENDMGKIYRIRRLTPREELRLMGVSDKDIDTMLASGISDTQLYKLAGNSIVVDVLGNVTKDSDGDPIFGGIFAQMFRNDGNLF